MLLAKKFQLFLCSLMLLFLTPCTSYAATIPKYTLSPSKQGAGTISPPGKVTLDAGGNQTFTFSPSTDAYEVKTVKVDGKAVTLTTPNSFTFINITKSHTLSVAFAKKTFEIHPINQNLQMGTLTPSKLIRVTYGASLKFTAKPKTGYRAILRVDGEIKQTGLANKPLSFRLDNIKEPHTVGALYEAIDNTPVKATVTVNAIDFFTKTNVPLHYQWKVSEGSIENVDAPTTTWTLPTGPGVHFANVLVYNKQGGYAARRIAVITDKLGTSAPVVSSPRDFEAKTTFGKSYAYDSVFMVTEATDAADSILLNRFVYLNNFSVTEPTLDGLASDSQGRLIATPLDIYHEGDLVEPPFSSTATHPHTHSHIADYIVGSVQLEDGSLCGTDDKFHGVNVAATATAVNNSGIPLSSPVTVNAYGDYALPWQATATQVLIKCESAQEIYMNVNLDTRIAEKAIIPRTGQPVVTPDASSMTVTVNNKPAGIFLPPELNQPSDLHPSGDKFLGFKGMDTQQQACQYYKSIGAVQECDGQGNPSGAITFDDWKHKMQMDPYAKEGAKDVEATYVNRIDLNLTRRHHAISYDDQPGAKIISAGSYYNCAIKTDNTVGCWGGNYLNQSSPHTDIFKYITAGYSHVCGIKTDDTVVCWGDNYYGQATPILGSFSQISAGGSHTCGIKTDDSVVCWGDNTYGQATPILGSFSQVSAGYSHTCGIKTDGSVVCWGDNYYGQATPILGSFSQVSAGYSHTCGIKTDGSVVCWGDNTYGQATPPLVGSFNRVSAGMYHNCGIKIDGSVACWGSNNSGEASPPAGNFSQVTTGSSHTCGFKTDGTVVCWGDNSDGQASPPDFKHRVAAYVCNHLGPRSSTRKELEWAIDNAINDSKQVACVAMDYQIHNSGETPYVRFFVFTANGQLSLSINLDGRQEKYVPGTCVACHGGDKYDGHFPGDGTGSPDVGAHFLPYDVGNFLFSNRPGLTKAAQQAAIHQLNNIVLQTNATPIERTLINNWYKSGSDILDEHYWPDDWKKEVEAKTYPGIDIEHVYKDVNARYCRTCHVALNRDGMGSGGENFDNPEYIKRWAAQVDDAAPLAVCGKSPNPDGTPPTTDGKPTERKNSPFLHDNHTMPNSLVTFNLLWKDKHAVGLLRQMLGDDCSPNNPDPELSIRK